MLYVLHQANTFIDKRFGEYDETLSLEEKMLKRFASEKQVLIIDHNTISINCVMENYVCLYLNRDTMKKLAFSILKMKN